MSEHLNKKALLDWHKERIEHWKQFRKTFKDGSHSLNEICEVRIDTHQVAINLIQSGAFDADDDLAKENERLKIALFTHESYDRTVDDMHDEIQRLRAAAIKLHETLNTYWQGDCEKADVVAVQSKLCDVLGADRDDELYGDWTDERCPKCGANLLGNKVGDKWCSLVGCDYSINALKGDENDA